MQVFMELACDICHGKGWYEGEEAYPTRGGDWEYNQVQLACEKCNGTGDL